MQLNALLESERTIKYQLCYVQDAIYVYSRMPNNIISDILLLIYLIDGGV